MDRETAAAFATCTTCMACEEACPSGVPVVDIVNAARAQVVRDARLPWVKRAVFGGVKRPGMLRAAADAAARLQGAAFTQTRRPRSAAPALPVRTRGQARVPAAGRAPVRASGPAA